jgi:glutathione S-transferase
MTVIVDNMIKSQAVDYNDNQTNNPISQVVKPKLWHCYNARSLRVLWALEELNIDYDVEVLSFPPRYRQPGYKDINALGTVPYFVDGQAQMTESSAICHYLAGKYGSGLLDISIEHSEYANYLNWLYHGDATLTFPQTLVLRYRVMAPKENTQQQTADDYEKWFVARLVKLSQYLSTRQYLCDNRFTMADIVIGYALYLGELLRLSHHYSPQLHDYLKRLKQRPAFIKAQQLGIELNPFSS